jgi:hypothetical protein
MKKIIYLLIITNLISIGYAIREKVLCYYVKRELRYQIEEFQNHVTKVDIAVSYLDSINSNSSDKYAVMSKSDLDTIMNLYFKGENLGGN